MHSKSDYENMVASKKPKDENIVSLEIKRAAPQMEVLTNSEEWNKYLSYLEPLAEAAEQKVKDLTVQILNPTLFDSDKFVLLKSEHIRMTERVEVIRELMTFPKQIIELGKINS